MSFTAFVYGFISAFVFLGVLVVVGGKKGSETIKAKLEELKKAQKRNPKVLEAAKLDSVKITSTVTLHVHGVHSGDKFVPAKISLSGTKLRINLIDEKEGVSDSPIAILTTTALACSPEEKKEPPPKVLYVYSKDAAEPLFRDEQHGIDWKRVDFKFETARELERWQNVIGANLRTIAWKDHVKSLPSLDVFNVFLSRILFELNNGPEFTALITKKIVKKLKTVKLPLKGTLTLNSLALGKEIPYISGVSFLSYNTTGEFAFDFNFVYKGGLFLQLVAQLELKGIHLPPVIISVQIQSLEGNVHLSIGAPPSNKAWVGFNEAPKIQLTIKQQIHTGPEKGILGTIVSVIPDLSDLISDVVKVKLFEDMILPNMDDFPLPDVKDTPPGTPTEKPFSPPITSGKPNFATDLQLPTTPSTPGTGTGSSAAPAKATPNLSPQPNPTSTPPPLATTASQPVQSSTGTKSETSSALPSPNASGAASQSEERGVSSTARSHATPPPASGEKERSKVEAVAARAHQRAEDFKHKVGEIISATKEKARRPSQMGRTATDEESGTDMEQAKSSDSVTESQPARTSSGAGFIFTPPPTVAQPQWGAGATAAPSSSTATTAPSSQPSSAISRTDSGLSSNAAATTAAAPVSQQVSNTSTVSNNSQTAISGAAPAAAATQPTAAPAAAPATAPAPQNSQYVYRPNPSWSQQPQW